MRGQPKLQERLESADEVLLPVTVLGELCAGFEGGSRLASKQILLDGLPARLFEVFEPPDRIAARG